MIIYILLIVLCVLLALVSLGFLIAGLVKKRQKLWVGGLGAFILFALLTVFSSYFYVKKQIAYMSSDEFQEDTRQAAENWGRGVGNSVSGAAKGLEESLDDDVIAKLAEKSGTIVGKSVKSVAKGMDEEVGKTTIISDKSLEALGIEIGRVEEVLDTAGYRFGVYLDFKKEYKGDLILYAYDSEGLKQDNSVKTLDKRAGDEGIEYFMFEHFEPGLSGYCILKEK